jgi:hypothetical protein
MGAGKQGIEMGNSRVIVCSVVLVVALQAIVVALPILRHAESGQTTPMMVRAVEPARLNRMSVSAPAVISRVAEMVTEPSVKAEGQINEAAVSFPMSPIVTGDPSPKNFGQRLTLSYSSVDEPLTVTVPGLCGRGPPHGQEKHVSIAGPSWDHLYFDARVL